LVVEIVFAKIVDDVVEITVTGVAEDEIVVEGIVVEVDR